MLLVIIIIVTMILASASIIVTLHTDVINKTEIITNTAEGITHKTQNKID